MNLHVVDTTEEFRKKNKRRNNWTQEFEWCFEIYHTRRHMVNKEGCCKKYISPRSFWDRHTKKKSLCNFKKMPAFFICNTILLWCANTRCSMNDAIFSKLSLPPMYIYSLPKMIRKKNFQGCVKPSTNHLTKSFKDKAAISIAYDPVQHNRIKHIEVGCHFIKEMLLLGLIYIPFVKTTEQLPGVFTKGLSGLVFNNAVFGSHM